MKYNTDLITSTHNLFDFRMLKRISIFIPNGKLVSYLKAYDNVSNVINFSSKTPKNWASWCSEYYTCNDTNTFSVTNVTDSK